MRDAHGQKKPAVTTSVLVLWRLLWITPTRHAVGACNACVLSWLMDSPPRVYESVWCSLLKLGDKIERVRKLKGSFGATPGEVAGLIANVDNDRIALVDDPLAPC